MPDVYMFRSQGKQVVLRKSMLSFFVIREMRKEKVKERTIPNGTAHTPVIHLTVLGRTLRSA